MYQQVFSAAKQVDQAFLVIFGFAVFILVFITVLMLWFLYRYHHTRHPVPVDSKGNLWAETIWTILPTIIVLGLFWTGWTSFKAMRTIPEGAMEVHAEGRMWSWRFTYDTGKKSDILVVPVNTPVKLNLSAKDVIHSFYVPAMRLKWDMVPGMDTDAWFESDATGDFDIFCAEYCGLRHSDMVTTLRVVEQNEFERWLQPASAADGGSGGGLDGRALLEEHGCLDCHALDGSVILGPPLNGLKSTEAVVVLPDGTTTTMDRDADYLRRALLAPAEELVKGYDDIMPPYEGAIPEPELQAMIDWLMDPDAAQSARADQSAPHPGQVVADDEGCLSCHSTDGSEGVGPSFLGLAGSMRTVAAAQGGQREAMADPAYLRRSITAPSELITDGYADMMPPYDYLEDQQLRDLIEWLGTMGEGATP